MPQTPKQARQAAAKQIEKRLPAKTQRNGETVVPDHVLRKIARELKR